MDMPAKPRVAEETKKIIRDLWMAGYSSNYIGEKVGKTRRAIIGTVNRLGLLRVDRPANPSPYKQAHHNQYTGRKPIIPLKAILGQKRSDGTPVTIVDIPMPEPSVAAKTSYRIGGKIDFMALKDNTCRWPLGDPAQWSDFGYCGATTNGICPYCVIHNKISFSRPSVRGGRFVVR